MKNFHAANFIAGKSTIFVVTMYPAIFSVPGSIMKFSFRFKGSWLLAPIVFWFRTETFCCAQLPALKGSKTIFERVIPKGAFTGAISLSSLQSVVLKCILVFTAILLLSLTARLATLTVLAHGGMRHRRVAAAALRLSFVSSIGLGAAAFLSAILCAVEVSELPVYDNIPAWSSDALPLLFALLLIAAAGFSLVDKEAQTRFQIALSERCYRVLFEESLAGVYKSTLDGRILDCNFSFCQVLGYASRAEILSQPPNFEYFKEEDRERFNAWLLAEGHLENFEQCLRRKDGASAWILNTATLVRVPAGAVPVIKGTILDITDLRMELPAWLRRASEILATMRPRRKET